MSLRHAASRASDRDVVMHDPHLRGPPPPQGPLPGPPPHLMHQQSHSHPHAHPHAQHGPPPPPPHPHAHSHHAPPPPGMTGPPPPHMNGAPVPGTPAMSASARVELGMPPPPPPGMLVSPNVNGLPGPPLMNGSNGVPAAAPNGAPPPHGLLPPGSGPPPPPSQHPALQRLAEANEKTWLLIGSVAEQMGNMEKALNAYENALRHNPFSRDGLMHVASISRVLEHYPKAIEFFQRVLREDENNGEVWSALGHCYLMQDDLQRAYAAYQQALYLLAKPKDDPKLWYGIGILYDRYGSLDHAEEAFQTVLEMNKEFDKSNEILFRLGIIYKQQAKYPESLECFQRIIPNPPKPLSEADVWFQIGHVYEQQKDYTNARDAYERVVQENPRHAKVLQQLGWLYHEEGSNFQNQDIAIQHLTKSLEADPADAQSWYLLGRAYMACQKYNKAYEAYQQAVYRDGRNPTFWCSIGVLYFQINQYRDALDAYSRAIRINPYISEVWFDLGSLYESCNNQITDAIDAYARAAELDPQNPTISQRLTLLKTAQQTGQQVPAAPGPQDVHPTAYANSVAPPQLPPPLLQGGPQGRSLFPRPGSRGPDGLALPPPPQPTGAPLGRHSPGPFRGGPPPPVIVDESRRGPGGVHLGPMELDRPSTATHRNGNGLTLHQPVAVPARQSAPPDAEPLDTPSSQHGSAGAPPQYFARPLRMPSNSESPPPPHAGLGGVRARSPGVGNGYAHARGGPAGPGMPSLPPPPSASTRSSPRYAHAQAHHHRGASPPSRMMEREREREWGGREYFGNPQYRGSPHPRSVMNSPAPMDMSPPAPRSAHTDDRGRGLPPGPGAWTAHPDMREREYHRDGRPRTPPAPSSRRYDPLADRREPPPPQQQQHHGHHGTPRREREEYVEHGRIPPPPPYDYRQESYSSQRSTAGPGPSGRGMESPQVPPPPPPPPSGGRSRRNRDTPPAPQGQIYIPPPPGASYLEKRERRKRAPAADKEKEKEKKGQQKQATVVKDEPIDQPPAEPSSRRTSYGDIQPPPNRSHSRSSASGQPSAVPSPASGNSIPTHLPPPRVSRVVDEDYDEPGVADALMGLARGPGSGDAPVTEEGRQSRASRVSTSPRVAHRVPRSHRSSISSQRHSPAQRSPSDGPQPGSAGSAGTASTKSGSNPLKRPHSPFPHEHDEATSAKRTRVDILNHDSDRDSRSSSRHSDQRGSGDDRRTPGVSSGSRPSPIPFRTQSQHSPRSPDARQPVDGHPRNTSPPLQIPLPPHPQPTGTSGASTSTSTSTSNTASALSHNTLPPIATLKSPVSPKGSPRDRDREDDKMQVDEDSRSPSPGRAPPSAGSKLKLADVMNPESADSASRSPPLRRTASPREQTSARQSAQAESS